MIQETIKQGRESWSERKDFSETGGYWDNYLKEEGISHGDTQWKTQSLDRGISGVFEEWQGS